MKTIKPYFLLIALLFLLASVSHAVAVDGMWLLSPATNDWDTGTNWSSSPAVPDGKATFDVSNTTSLTFSSLNTAIGTLQFNAAAPAYTFTLMPPTGSILPQILTINGAGIVNNSAFAPSFLLQPNNFNFGGQIVFTNASTAANAQFTLGCLDCSLDFKNTATAGSAMINLNNFSNVTFHDSSTAGTATINVNSNATFFRDTSSAISAKITNFSAGGTFFDDASTAANAHIVNDGGFTSLGFSPGSTATAANAVIENKNGGFTSIDEKATGGNATITNNAGGLLSIAGAQITINGAVVLGFTVNPFDGTGSAGNATIVNNNGGETDIIHRGSAGTATITNNNGGSLFFLNNPFVPDPDGSTARVINNAGGKVDISAVNAGVSIGSVEGAGQIFLGSKSLTLGNTNLNTQISGVIADGGLAGGTGGSLTKVGTGKLILSGNNTYTGPTVIINGVVQVDGSIASPNTSVNAGGALTGVGTLGGNLTNGGTVGPGDSPGTLHVNGNYTQNSAATLQIEIGGTAPAQHDLLAIGGTASLNGTLQLIRLNNFTVLPGDKIIFLTAAGGRTGTFSTVVNPFTSSSLLQAQVIYESNDVAVAFIQGNFNIGGLTFNQTVVAEELNLVASDRREAALIAFLDNRPLVELPHDYDLIAPEEFAALYEMSFSNAVVRNSSLQQRMEDIRAGSNGFCAAGFAPQVGGNVYSKESDGKAVLDKNEAPAFVPAPDNCWGIFVTGQGQYVSVGQEDENAAGYGIEDGGFIAGLDYRVSPNLAVGIYTGFDAGRATLAEHGWLKSSGGNVGAFLTYNWRGFYVDVAGGGGWNGYSTRRVALGGDALGDADGSEVNAIGAIGYDFRWGCLNIGPMASIQYTDVNINAFTERDSLAPLQIEDQDEDSLRSSVGVHAGYDLHLGPKGVIFRPELSVAWLHEFNDEAYPIDARFASGAGDVFRVLGPRIGRDAAQIRAGARMQLSSAWALSAYYDGVLGRGNYDSNGASGGFLLGF